MASRLPSFASVSGILHLVRAAENSIAAALKLAADGGPGDKNGGHPVRVERNGRDAYVTFDDDLRAAM
jgi:hypothetical protein